MDPMNPQPAANMPNGATNSDLIYTSSIQTFGDDVLKASTVRPVIVDFWADWCEPCKQLMPALEAAVTAAGGAVALAKVNADENKTLCGQLQVQSLPTVIAFWQGQPVDGFQGAVPPSQIQQFIERLTQMSGGAGMPDDPVTAAMEQADAAFEAGDMMAAAGTYQQILSVEPMHAGAAVGMADMAAKSARLEDAKEILAQLDKAAIEDKAILERMERIETAIDMAAQAEGVADTAVLEAAIADDPTNHQARFDLALALQARGDMEGAADSLLAIIMRDREWQDDEARKQLVKLFEVAGPADPFTLKYRRRLSSILFS